MANLIEIFSHTGQGKSFVILNKINKTNYQGKKGLLIVDEIENGLYRRRILEQYNSIKDFTKNCRVLIMCSEFGLDGNNDKIFDAIRNSVDKAQKTHKVDRVFVDCLYMKLDNFIGNGDFIKKIRQYSDVDGVIIAEQLGPNETSPKIFGDIQYVCQKEGNNIVLTKANAFGESNLFNQEKEVITINE